MPIPNFQTFMLPLLRIAADRKDHRVGELAEPLADLFGLSADERKELLPSGGQRKLINRVAWAVSDLRRAGLLEGARGSFRITDRGLETLESGPTELTRKGLTGLWSELGPAEPDVAGSVQTPREMLEAGYQALRRELVEQVLEQARGCSWQRFEQIVVDLLIGMGYGGSHRDAGRVVGRTGDEGIDGVIKQDPLGLDVIYVQAKRWDGVVGRPLVQGFVGSLEGQRARKGVMITTSKFSADAVRYAENMEKRVILISGQELAEFMVDHGVGVVAEGTFVMKRLDLDYFTQD